MLDAETNTLADRGRLSYWGTLGDNVLKYVGLFAAVIALAACETTSTRPYTISTENVMAFQKALKPSGQMVQVSDFTLAEGVSETMTCRMLGQLDVAPGKTPVQFIQSAMQDELFNAGVIDGDAGTMIYGRIDALDFSSLGTGSWTIALNVSSEDMPEGYTVDTDYKFKTSYSAINACQNVIDAFTPAVQELIGKVVTHPEFTKLAGVIAVAESETSGEVASDALN